MFKVGIVFGCFVPMHAGHMAMIDRALAENDHAIIAVCGSDHDRGKDFIPFRERVRLVEEKFRHQEGVHVVAVDDKAIGLTGTFSLNAWDRWVTELFMQSGYDMYDEDIRYTWYTGEPGYARKLWMLYPEHTFILLDRSVVDISGTRIREDWKAYREYVEPGFLKYLEDRG